MIDFQILPRRSGKTKYIREMYSKTGGTIVLPGFNYLMEMARYPEINRYDCCTAEVFKKKMISVPIKKHVFFDEFMSQSDVTFFDIMQMDSQNPEINIIVRTSNIYFKEIPEYFIEYMKKNYPEYCI